MNIERNSNGLIFKVTTQRHLNISEIIELGRKHNMVVSQDMAGDFCTMSFPGKSPRGKHTTDFGTGLLAAAVSDTGFNNWTITTGVSAQQLESIQPLLNDIADTN